MRVRGYEGMRIRNGGVQIRCMYYICDATLIRLVGSSVLRRGTCTSDWNSA